MLLFVAAAAAAAAVGPTGRRITPPTDAVAVAARLILTLGLTLALVAAAAVLETTGAAADSVSACVELLTLLAERACGAAVRAPTRTRLGVPLLALTLALALALGLELELELEEVLFGAGARACVMRFPSATAVLPWSAGLGTNENACGLDSINATVASSTAGTQLMPLFELLLVGTKLPPMLLLIEFAVAAVAVSGAWLP